MDHAQWERARFDAYSKFVGRIEYLGTAGRYTAREIKAEIRLEIRELDRSLGRIDGLIMDNGSQPADHAP